jgi:hypothetical protein
MVDATEACTDLLDGTLIRDLHDDGVHFPQVVLGPDELVL